MTCRACTVAKDNPRTGLMTVGCVSCEGRALAAMGFTRDEIDGKHAVDVIEAFDQWVPIVRQQAARTST